MNTINSVGNSQKGSDMSQIDVAISGSEVDEQEVPENELVTVYPGTAVDEGNQNG